MRALLLVAALTSAAAAEPSVELTIQGNQVEAHVRGADKKDPVLLRDLVDEKHAEVTATSVRGFTDRPVALVFVLHGTEFLGHSMYYDDPWSDYPDHFKPLSAALGNLGLATRLPAGSEALLVSYAADAAIKTRWKPAASFNGEDIGAAIDYKGRTGTSLVAGVDLAIGELERKKDVSKLVVIIGDGNDTNNDVGRASLARVASDHPEIAFAALVIKTPLSHEGEIVSELTTTVFEVDDENLEAPLSTAIGLAMSRFDATFDLAAFPHDGALHRFALVVGGEHVASSMLPMPPAPPVPPPSKAWRYLVVLGVLAGFGLVSFVMFRPKGR